MNANIYILLKSGNYEKAYASLKRLIEEVKESIELDLNASDVRRAIKVGRFVISDGNGGSIEVRRETLF